MKSLHSALFSLVLFTGTLHAIAQGCSDAGFCTAGALHNNTASSGIKNDTTQYQNEISISVTAGSGEQGTAIIIPQAEWVRQWNKKTSLEIKLPFYYAHGTLGNHTGLGDPVLTITHLLKTSRTWNIYGVAGIRIGTGNAAATDRQGRPLPMPYQASLGTTDIIGGVSAAWKTWLSFAAGYQQPIAQYNRNGYISEKYPGADKDYTAYFSSRQLYRKGDFLLRADGHYRYHRLTFTAGPLLIYHLGKDRITLADGTQTSLAGSEGATLNATGSISYDLRHLKAELSAGTPFIVRDYRPDGLTREWVITLKLSWRK
ncbi:hypothetical protein ACTHGU_13340 [Chitinophagaceae bacterium MMS25-I14]